MTVAEAVTELGSLIAVGILDPKIIAVRWQHLSQGDGIIIMSSRFCNGGGVNASYQEKVWLLLHNVGREEYTWHLSDVPDASR